MLDNPIIRGFNPDPSFIRVGDDYYIATSTFEWYPGVQIHHSTDLVNWRICANVLDRQSQLDLRGTVSSGGVWAPNLSYDQGTFYLVYTDVKNRKGVYKDTHNYLVTAQEITGPWSEPTYLNSSGFDPALFHDDDGRKWLINMCWNFRRPNRKFDGILLQEFNEEKGKLIGPIKKIIEGKDNWVTEGSNLYKYNGYYYMLLAEGGTGFNHSVTVARAETIGGTYQLDPSSPLLTARHNPDHPIQKAGHGSLIQTQSGEWYMAYLCARPLPDKMCPLGRETAIQKCYWSEDNWLRLAGDSQLPLARIPEPDLPKSTRTSLASYDDFGQSELALHFHTLRVPASEDWLSLTKRPGFLRLRGRESLTSLYDQSVVARKVQHFYCDVETAVLFEPTSFNHMAGLICLFDEDDLFYLRLSYDEDIGKHINVIWHEKGQYYEDFDSRVALDDLTICYLKLTIRLDRVQFFFATKISEWQPIGPTFNFGQLGDAFSGKLGFTGAYVGMCAQDIANGQQYADFEFFHYKDDVKIEE
ncbi:xylan 1,4-beta-xylosidase [Amphibacillus marinus]|uniref:Xylan 1,4-beta-xylosidase n=1 Tax=Amphibacillus marinus TaxID=872970 RepID=A0A1H8RAH4_9BACI|nr:glycoside hydrolase family 43 protein [Amphibacillus marinus]SEO63400.1 xylan 1,4-beta-xylosidase [Amphibacillus marinus]